MALETEHRLLLGVEIKKKLKEFSLELSFEAEKGCLGILGPSGCGKSMTLKSIAGIVTPDSGRIALQYAQGEAAGGRVLFDSSLKINETPQIRRVGYLFQNYALFPNMTVEENIAFGLKLKKMEPAAIREKVAGAIKMVELNGKEKQHPASLSGGQQQRVALARSIVMEPKVLLLDEPLSAIDAKLRKSLQISIKQITKKLGLTAIFVTHDQDEAMVMSDVINLFHEGRIEQSGDPVSVYTKPVSSFAASFIGNYNQITSEQFQTMTGTAKAGEVAIRPETFSISSAPIVNDEEYHFEGIIEDNMPRGNVLRYQINVNGVKLHADVLFRSRVLFDNGDKVYMSVAEHNCISL